MRSHFHFIVQPSIELSFCNGCLTSHEMELAAFLGLYYSTISRLVNAVDKHQKERPALPWNLRAFFQRLA